MKKKVYPGYPRATSLVTLPDYILLVGFADGEYRLYDLKNVFDTFKFNGKYVFHRLKTEPGLYEKAKLVFWGEAVEWDEELDISTYDIYVEGEKCSPPKNVGDETSKLIATVINIRQNLGVSQKQLEALSGILQPAIARMEKGLAVPRLDTLLKLLDAMGYTLKVVQKSNES